MLWIGLVVSLTSLFAGVHTIAALQGLSASWSEYTLRRRARSGQGEKAHHNNNNSETELAPTKHSVPPPSLAAAPAETAPVVAESDAMAPENTQSTAAQLPSSLAPSTSSPTAAPAAPAKVASDPLPVVVLASLLLICVAVVVCVLLGVLPFASTSFTGETFLWSCLFAPPGTSQPQPFLLEEKHLTTDSSYVLGYYCRCVSARAAEPVQPTVPHLPPAHLLY